MLVDYDVIRKTLPLLDRKNVAVGLEVLSLVDLLLFNANRKGQVRTRCRLVSQYPGLGLYYSYIILLLRLGY